MAGEHNCPQLNVGTRKDDHENCDDHGNRICSLELGRSGANRKYRTIRSFRRIGRRSVSGVILLAFGRLDSRRPNLEQHQSS